MIDPITIERELLADLVALAEDEATRWPHPDYTACIHRAKAELDKCQQCCGIQSEYCSTCGGTGKRKETPNA